MDLIKTELEKALNNSFPMRGINRGWCYAGNFYVNDKKYAYYGALENSKITCRCMEAENYANHWFELDSMEIEPNKTIFTIGEILG